MGFKKTTKVETALQKKGVMPLPERGTKLNITKAERKEMVKLIKDLPEMKSDMLKERRALKGSHLIASGMLKTKEGEKINPSKYYETLVPKVVNHKTEAEKAFRKGGMEAVKIYVEQIKQRVREFNEELDKNIKNLSLEGKL